MSFFLCTTPNSLTTPQPFYALLKLLLPMAICLHLCCETHAKTPWNFDIIFFRMAERLAAYHLVWGSLPLQGSWMTPALAGHCQR
jgi:hypothetical protein